MVEEIKTELAEAAAAVVVVALRPTVECVEQSLAPLLSYKAALINWLAPDVGFNGVENLDATQRFFGDRQLRGLENFEEFCTR